jgi:membrane complex biogenesis BtpA family protein
VIPGLFSTRKTIIGMAHLGPLPGSPLYDATRGMAGLVADIEEDIAALQAGGVDAIMFGNEGDRPYLLKATPESLAAMAAIIGQVKARLTVPFGVNYLWDPVATVGLAVATGASFAREVFTGVYASDMGMWQPDCAGALRLRAQLGRPDLKLLFNVNAEFASALDQRSVAQRVRSVVFSSLADVICVSGAITGQAVDGSDLDAAKGAAGSVPVFANTGVNIDNVEKILAVADGCVIGTHFKREGYTWNKVDPDRVARFMERVRGLRG